MAAIESARDKKKPVFIRAFISWGGRRGSNPRQPESQSGTLPTELRPPLLLHLKMIL